MAQWVRGQRLKAEVVERASEGDLICSFEGRLLRVKNRSGRIYREKDVIDLIVVSSEPLELRPAESYRHLHRVL